MLMTTKRWIAGGVILAGLTLSICMLALVGGAILRVRTPEETIVLENLPDGAEVFVDGSRVNVKTGAAYQNRPKTGPLVQGPY
jgi:hypothetical protein